MAHIHLSMDYYLPILKTAGSRICSYLATVEETIFSFLLCLVIILIYLVIMRISLENRIPRTGLSAISKAPGMTSRAATLLSRVIGYVSASIEKSNKRTRDWLLRILRDLEMMR